MVILLKIKRRLVLDETALRVSRTVTTRKFKLLYFRNETCYGNGKLYKGLLFVYLQPSVNKNKNSRFFSSQNQLKKKVKCGVGRRAPGGEHLGIF